MNRNSDTALQKPALRRATAQWRNHGTVHRHSELHTTPCTKLNIGDKIRLTFNIDETEVFSSYCSSENCHQEKSQRCEVRQCRKAWECDYCCCKTQCKWCIYSPLVTAKRFEMYKQNLPAATEISLTTFFFNWFQNLQKRRSQGCLGQAFFSCVPKCTNYCKESDIKILFLPPHTTHVLRPLPRTVPKPFKTNCHQ
jgi:hypothetical protein